MKKIQQHIQDMMRGGSSQRKAIASALSMHRKMMATGGLVNSDFNEEGKPQAVSAEENSYDTSKPSAAAQEPAFEPDMDQERGIVEIQLDGEYDPSDVAHPSLADAVMMAEGGMLEGAGLKKQSQKASDFFQRMRQPVQNKAEGGEIEAPLSADTMAAIEAKRKKRRYV